MANVSAPAFYDYEKQTDVWVTCASVKAVSSMEAACTVEGIGQTRVIIAPTSFFNIQEQLVRGVLVGTDGNGDRLVDLPSGARILIAEDRLSR